MILDFGLIDFLETLFTGQATKLTDAAKQNDNDSRMRLEFSDILSPTCRYDEIPSSLPATESGYDISFDLRLGHKPFDFIDVVVEEPSLFKVLFTVTNPRNNLNAFIYQNS